MAKDTNRDSLTDYRLVQPAEVFFGSLAEKEKLELKKHPSLSSLFNLILIRIYTNLLKLVENVIGIRLYSSINDPLPPDISLKTRKLTANSIQKKFIQRVTKLPRLYPDEPWLRQYQAETPTSLPDISSFSDGQGSFSKYSGGIDFNEEGALIKAVGEGLERLCLCVYREKNYSLSLYGKISKKALNPLSFAGISPAQRQTNPRLKIDEKSVFRWVEGRSLFDNKKILIPAQLVYIGYKYAKGEPMIQDQISTGAAAADSFEKALYGGICEAVERDALMVTYLNKLSPPLIDPNLIKDKEFQKLLAMFKRYNLELYIIDITTDIVIPSIVAVIIDRTGVGPVIHLGAKTNLYIKEAVLGAVCEALRGRLGFRGKMPLDDNSKKKQKLVKSNPSQIITFEDRDLFWNSLDMLREIEFLFQGPEKKIAPEDLDRYKNFSGREKFETSLDILKKANIDIYGVDITMPKIKEDGVYVAKVVSPQLQPLYLNEGIKHDWGERLFNVPVKLGYRAKSLSEKELNLLPHPFL